MLGAQVDELPRAGRYPTNRWAADLEDLIEPIFIITVSVIRKLARRKYAGKFLPRIL